MTRISEKQLPNLLDKRLYTTIKGFFDPTQHKPETVMDEFLGSKQRLPSSESVLLHFLALEKAGLSEEAMTAATNVLTALKAAKSE